MVRLSVGRCQPAAAGCCDTAAVSTGRSAGSLAFAGAANEYFWIDPACRVAGVLLMQYFPFCDHAALATFSALETGIYGLIKGGQRVRGR